MVDLIRHWWSPARYDRGNPLLPSTTPRIRMEPRPVLCTWDPTISPGGQGKSGPLTRPMTVRPGLSRRRRDSPAPRTPRRPAWCRLCGGYTRPRCRLTQRASTNWLGSNSPALAIGRRSRDEIDCLLVDSLSISTPPGSAGRRKFSSPLVGWLLWRELKLPWPSTQRVAQRPGLGHAHRCRDRRVAVRVVAFVPSATDRHGVAAVRGSRIEHCAEHPAMHGLFARAPPAARGRRSRFIVCRCAAPHSAGCQTGLIPPSSRQRQRRTCHLFSFAIERCGAALDIQEPNILGVAGDKPRRASTSSPIRMRTIVGGGGAVQRHRNTRTEDPWWSPLPTLSVHFT